MTTFGAILDRNKGIGPGFDFARIFLAFAVLVYHVPETAYGPDIDLMHMRVVWILYISILPMFFGLSGFLVAGSAQRLSLTNFALNRGFRIVPALAVEICLSALILGPLLTTFTIGDYFADPKFGQYFQNIVGIIHFKLPGVFLSNPLPEIVNGSIWTVPHEILCYLVMAALIYSGLVRNGYALLGLALVAALLAFLSKWHMDSHHYTGVTALVYDRYYAAGLGSPLLPCFLMGAAFYHFRSRIPQSLPIFGACVAATLFVGFVEDVSFWDNALLAFCFCPVMVYIVCYIGLTKIPPVPLYHRGDYSYGIYLYGFPIQQSLLFLIPWLRTHIVAYAVASIVVTSLFAVFSWHVIEKPVLRLRKRVSFASRLTA